MAHWTEELFIDNPELFQSNFDARAEHVSGEVDFLLEKLKEHGFQSGRILDLNCGIGRHSVELGKRGQEVVGTDISPQYIVAAGKKAEEAGVKDRTTFKVVDMREIASKLSAEKPFDGIICMWTAFGYYDDDTNDDILRQCVRLIKPGGFFALDIINRDWLLSAFADSGYHTVGDMIVLEERQFDVRTSRNASKWVFLRTLDETNYKSLKTVTIDHRIWSLHELVSLYERAGLEHVATYAGFGPGFHPQQKPIESLRELMPSRMLLCIGRKQ